MYFLGINFKDEKRYTLTNYDLSTDGKPFVIFRFFFLEIKTSQNLEALDVAAWMQDSV